MRKAVLIALVAFGVGPVSGLASAQTAGTIYRHHPRPATSGGGGPIDHGPYTPEANRAYQGGGMVLEGAPGAPPPRPQATPPGQTPANMVPQ